VINTKQSLNVFATQAVMERLMINFDYLFKPLRNPNFNKDGSFEGIEPQASLISNIFGEYDEIQLQNKKIRCFKQNHGSVDSIGFEFGNGKFVYSPDLKFLPEKTIDFLRSLEIDLWVLPLTHIKGNKNHIGLDEIMDLIRLIKPKRVVLIHMNHSIEYYELKDMLCESEIQIEPGFDGMEFEI
jgi:phosphoribosyl 1,2-cyclic phosphate phosphodiesterase